MSDAKVFSERMKRVRDFLGDKDADFALLTPSPNFLYLTGIEYEMRERLIALVVSPDNEPLIIAPSFEGPTLKGKTWIREFILWNEDEDPYRCVHNAVASSREGHTAFFDDGLPLGVFWSVQRQLDDLREVYSLSPFLGKMRLRKSETELEMMKKAGNVIDVAVGKSIDAARLGMTELEVSEQVRREVVRQGAVPTFATVQFGENSAHPHSVSGDRKLVLGDTMLLDCGCSVGGYNTDMTRTVFVGESTTEQAAVYSVVLKAQEAALSRLSKGLTCGSADGIARRVIEEAGYGDRFTHRLGHGVGLEIHEPPYLVRGNSMELEPGMTHSVEPGIYLEGHFGVRIEDLVCICDEGCERITYSDKAMRIIEAQ